MFMAGEHSQKCALHVNSGALLRGQAWEQMGPFSAPEFGGAGLLLRVASLHQYELSDTPTGHFDPLFVSFLIVRVVGLGSQGPEFKSRLAV